MTVWKFLLRFFGVRCCGEWSPWKSRRADFSRQPRDASEAIIAHGEPIEFTKHWQQRRCLKCGRIQQRLLDFPGNDASSPEVFASDPTQTDTDGLHVFLKAFGQPGRPLVLIGEKIDHPSVVATDQGHAMPLDDLITLARGSREKVG